MSDNLDAIRASSPAQTAPKGRQHVMSGDPANIGQIALQWYLAFEFGQPHSTRESNIAVEAFKDGYRAVLKAQTVGGERPSARELLAREYEKADAPPGAGTRWHAANVRAIGRLDYADWKDHAAIRAIEAALSLPAVERPTREEVGKLLYELYANHPDARWECVEPVYQETVWHTRADRLLALFEGR